ncbi:MAG: hypothetical protein AAGG68_15030 [Bacteroidota bacterium]
MQKLIPTLCLLLLFAFSTHAQKRVDHFSENPSEFIGQLKIYMVAGQPSVLEKTFEEFKRIFDSGMFTQPEMDTIVATGNKMLTMRMQANPFFKNYLGCLTLIKKNSSNAEQQFMDWHEVLNKTLDNIENKKTRSYSSFLEFSRTFYEQGALRYSKNGTSWIAKNGDFKMKYKEKTPIVEFSQTDLVAVRGRDSIQIWKTSGEYHPVTELWKGSGGVVNWNERFEIDEEIYAELPDTFSISMNTSLYKVKNAKLHYPSYFGNKLIVGNFEDKIVSGKDADYPAFESDKKVLEIDNIGKGIYFMGGFRLDGLTVYGYGTKNNRAVLKIYDDEEKQLLYKGESELVIIKRGDFLVGDRIESTIYYEQDSIYHPSVSIRFNIPKKELQLKRGKRGSDRNPFFSSTHQLTIDVENIHAYLRQDSIAIGKQGIALTSGANAYFESLHFFDEGEYMRAQGIADVNSIAIMAATAEREKTLELEADLIAKRMNSKFTEESIKSMLYEQMANGFIDYDSEEHKIYAKNKLVHYYDAARGKVDYDPLKIKSSTDSVNATLNLRTNELAVTGAKAIEFSRKQRVAILPDNEKVTIVKNRDMFFDGKLYAGYSTITGRGFDFEYDRYLINLDSVDFFDLYIPTGELNEKNEPEAISLDSRIEGLNGVLLIDAPSNKSGKEEIEIFPSFQSKKNSYVYYDKDDILEGIYDRDSFYFELQKFSFNHLDKITARDVRFPGELFPYNIMPPFKETLVVREDDQSLGFVHNTPAEGYPLYQDRGNFSGIVDLSNQGLRGEGDLTYLKATVYSEDIVYKPYQLTASAKTFDYQETRNEEVETPQVSGLDVAIDWRPYKDSMYISTKEKSFDMYQAGLHTLDGTLILTPGGIKGIGVLDWDKAVMQSPLFAFGANSATADTTTLSIKAENGAEVALSTSNVAGSVDFDTGKAEFKANNKIAVTKLPYNKYETSMNAFDWDMDAEEVRFKSNATQLGEFLSVHPDQDSLRFNGKEAFYDLKTNELQIDGVPHIRSADAFIYPDSNKVTVLPNAVVTTLENAKIVADVVNKNHVINRATVNILGKRVYNASGFYEYNIGDRKQEIEFSKIEGKPIGKGSYREKRVATRGTGKVDTRDSFYIDLKTEFQGTISLSSDSKALSFDGFARLDAEKLPQRQWFSLKSEGAKEDLVIRYTSPKNQEGTPLETGFFLSKATGFAYPSIMGALSFRKDRHLIGVIGMMRYDSKKDEFIFADSTKMVNPDAYKGNKLVFSNKTGAVEAEGKFNLGYGLKYISAKTAGFMKTQIIPKTIADTFAMPNYPVDAELMAAIDLIVPDKLMDIMIKDFQSSSYDAQAINFLKEPNFYRKATAELFPQNKEVLEAMKEINRGTLNLPSRYNDHTFVFGKLPMKWDADYQSFVTKGSRVGLVSINGELFNYVYKGYVEFKMLANGDDRLYIYLESPTGMSYYFGFKQGIMSITSSNTAFIQAAEALKSKELVQKMDDGETYEIQLVSPGTANMFVNRVRAAQKK